MPTMSAYALREGQRAAGCADAAHQIRIFDMLMDSKWQFLTGSTSTMYAIGFLDLERDGPTVIELPPGMLGCWGSSTMHGCTRRGVSVQLA